MIVKSLSLVNFRSYEKLELSLEPGLNLIVGPNGSGKSNLVEAIQYLSLAKSWRTNDDDLLIRQGSSSTYLSADIEIQNLNKHFEIELGNKKKKILVNGNPIRRLSELAQLANVIIFSPNDVPLFMGSPKERRDFLDLSLSKESAEYLRDISSYRKLLTERNAALKEENVDLRLIDVLTEQMIDLSEKIVSKRLEYVKKVNSKLPWVHQKLKGSPAAVEIQYHPFLPYDENFKEEARIKFQNSLEFDCRSKTTNLGIQREDFSFYLEGRDVADYGSQGENRMAVLSLKLVPYFLAEASNKPICVLDDVLSELDPNHSKNLLDLVTNMSQVFITSTQEEQCEASIIEVSPGIAIRRKK